MLINRKACRQFIAKEIGRTRPSLAGCRVSAETYTNIDAAVRRTIRAMIQRAPSKKTLKLI